MDTLTQADPVLDLLRALDAGVMFTAWAEAYCGQEITADVERLNPPYLFPDELGHLGMEHGESWAALRRHGHLVQADGTKVAKISSVVAAGRIPGDACRMLATTTVPLGRALGPDARREMLWSSPGIDQYAVCSCARLWLPVPGRGVLPVALATERVLRSWLEAGRSEAP